MQTRKFYVFERVMTCSSLYFIFYSTEHLFLLRAWKCLELKLWIFFLGGGVPMKSSSFVALNLVFLLDLEWTKEWAFAFVLFLLINESKSSTKESSGRHLIIYLKRLDYSCKWCCIWRHLVLWVVHLKIIGFLLPSSIKWGMLGSNNKII